MCGSTHEKKNASYWWNTKTAAYEPHDNQQLWKKQQQQQQEVPQEHDPQNICDKIKKLYSIRNVKMMYVLLLIH